MPLLNDVLDILKPHADMPLYDQAVKQVAVTARNHGYRVAEGQARAIADAYEDMKALAEIRAAERA